NFDDESFVSFWTRTSGTATFPDRLEIRACSGNPCSNVGSGAADVGDFTILLGTINPNLLPGGDPTGVTAYPYNAWGHFAYRAADGLPTSGQGRIAFRYWVTNSGPDGSNGSYIGIDTVTIQSVALTGGSGADVNGISETYSNAGGR